MGVKGVQGSGVWRLYGFADVFAGLIHVLGFVGFRGFVRGPRISGL